MSLFLRKSLGAALFILLAGTFSTLSASKLAAPANQSDNKVSVQVNCIAFYNQENLFDTINDPRINDEEFLPTGAMKWGSMKYKAKLKNMSYALSQIGTDICPQGAAIIGVSEIENRGVLQDLVSQPALADRSMEIVHYDGPDRRGVDVALLYNPRYFQVTNSKSYRLVLPNDTNFRTRDQLLVSGYLMGEKIHIIVNHWPSRLGGEEASRPKRNAAATLTRHIADSIYNAEKGAKIIIMGDLNDDPFNESCAKVIGARKNAKEVQKGEYYNTLWNTLEKGIGSLAYNDQWNLFDQIMISSDLLQSKPDKLKFWKAEVFNKPFLTQQEGRYKGSPLRTHAGGVWLNGYSDHYPTYIYVIKQVK